MKFRHSKKLGEGRQSRTKTKINDEFNRPENLNNNNNNYYYKNYIFLNNS